MTEYKITYEDRSLTSWKINEYNTLEYVELVDFCPVQNRLLHGDVFHYDSDTKKVDVTHSCIRNAASMPGVLILENNKMYGKEKSKCLYKCLPDDKRIPPFLIPYEIKRLGFNKKMVNKYVNFKFHKWETKHPIGMLTQTIGDVNILENFYEYQLFCKSLYASIQNFNKCTMKSIKSLGYEPEVVLQNIVKQNPNIQDRRQHNVFTIDGKGTQDFDDAISIQQGDNGNIIVSIYITNVCIWMDHLDLWDSFASRISTIYLPDKKRPMLPTILSDILCSLHEKQERIAFTLDLIINENKIIDVQYNNCLINVKKNYLYEEEDLRNLEDYKYLLQTARNLLPNHKFINNIKTSHDLIAYLMVIMNHFCAKHFEPYNNGIYRGSVFHDVKNNIPKELPEDVYNFMKIWGTTSGQYVLGKSPHEVLELDAYIHITSPIRRLVDLLNLMNIQMNMKIYEYSDNAKEFYKFWINKIDYINTTMRAIRKVQTECTLLELCTNNPEIRTTRYNGYMFDKITRNDGLFQYMCYIPELKLVSKVNSQIDKQNFDCSLFQIFLFQDENKMKQKIRIHLLE